MNNERNPQIEQYLDRLCEELKALPPEVQAETRTEIGQHLYSLAAMQRDPKRIVESALRQFGDPARVGQALAREWEEDAWDLSQLSLRERLEKIRAAIELESPPPHPSQRIIMGVQLYLLFGALSIFGAHGAGLPPHGEWTWLGIAALGVYAVVGLTSAVIEWQRAEPRGPLRKSRAYSGALGRAAASFWGPALILSPQQGHNVVFLLFALTLVPAVFNRFEPSRRARLATDSTMIFGGILGMMFALVAFVSIYFTGVPSLTWLLFPLGYIANRWLHKKPLLARRRVAP